MSTQSTPEDVYGASVLETNWQLIAIAGAIVALLGVLAIAFPLATGLSVTVALGVLLVVGGIVHGVTAVSTRGWGGTIWQLALAAVAVIAGVALLSNPVVGLASLTLLAIGYLLADGVMELAASTRMEGRGERAAVAVSGVLSLVIAGLLWAGFPADATWAIGLLVGVSLLVTGVSMLTVSMSGRKTKRSLEAGMADSRKA
ncbi:HdeD family acid-resistance protein [Natronolimnohabitans innermongolicus]|uniref:HdeD protein n=1 Tax=Natronolimnohabitans innermongolicus JCM 12255 TaxID=1227499 RepID=L9XL12_9EURY|nr:DUF308 domain-containing protein [Natronolimnohabitans innermongolicus]ELY62066.1 hypothetical protein C493_01010 [Natronolimnohabitans innermongolicus JCM 12255]